MPTYLPSRSGWRTALALFAFLVLLGSVALLATAASAGAPTTLSGQDKPKGGGTPSATPTICPLHWEVVYSPNPMPSGDLFQEDELYGLAAISANDMWAVGSSAIALTEHWDGTSWGVVTSTIAMSASMLYDVAAPSTDNAWAVGAYAPSPQYILHAVIMHWDGELWDVAPSPSTPPGSYLYGIEAVSANDIWAVGTQNNSTQTLAMHWNGSTWSIVPTPNPGANANSLRHVSALASNDAWAVGYTDQNASLIMHWNGAAWANVPVPFQGALYDVLALAANDVWAVGDGLIVHWNGSNWTSFPGLQGTLESLSATSPNDVWASGTTSIGAGDSLVMHWDGSTWSVVPSPMIANQGGTLHAIVALSSSEIWTVGEARRAYNNHISTVTMRYHPDCPMPTACSTGWNNVHGAYPGLDGGVTFGVSAISPNDVWAVGTGLEGFREQPLMEHWDGSYWSVVPGPAIPVNSNLNAVSAISANDVWAVGLIYTNGLKLEDRLALSDAKPDAHKPNGARVPNAYGTLTMHWDGQAWSWIPSPGPQTFNNPLDAVDGVASNDVWAAGALSFLHWNGTAWTQIDTGLGAGEIKSIAAISTNNVWAVGFIADPGSWNGLIIHWDGTGWSRLPNQDLIGHSLNDISAVSANDIWATGGGIIIHWDGSQWTSVQVPGNYPGNVEALAANDVWATTSTGMLHWDGTSWSVVPTPAPEPETVQGGVMDLAAASSNEIWAVGYARRPLTLLPTIERYVGSCQTPTATRTATAVPSPSATPSPTPTGCIQTWNVVNSPSPYQYSELMGVAARSSNDVWATGTNLIEHWNGSTWSVLTDTLPLSGTTQLYDVSAVSTNDAWAVGRGDGAGHYEGAILHWDGTLWHRIPNPDPSEETGLFGVEAIATDDVWAVGYQDAFQPSNVLALHWDGNTWRIITTPTLPPGSYKLFDVSAVASNDVWAVGWSDTGALTMHWDGSTWSIVPSPFLAQLVGVVAIGHNDVWASGNRSNGSGYDASIYHWDGTAWTLSTTLNGEVLYRMAATSSNDVWAVGRANGTLVMHWAGSVWSRAASPLPFPFSGDLWGVAALSPTEVWAVGNAGASNQTTTLTIRYSQWCPTPIGCTPGWNAIDAPNPSPDVNIIYGIDVVSANDIWAVGAFARSEGGTYALHWNGSYWAPVAVPGLPAVTLLYDVKALSANNVWAVGWADPSTRNGQDFRSLLAGPPNHDQQPESPLDHYQTVIVHWDGQSWTRLPSPSPGTTPDGSHLYSIDGVSADDLWAVGYYRDSAGFWTLILHWNGSVWTQVTSPAGTLHGVEAIAQDNVWAVGNGPSIPNTTLTLHWDGSQWGAVASPNPNSQSNQLSAVSAVSPTDIWAVGSQGTSYDPLTMHWDGSQWNVVSAPGFGELYAVSARATNDVWAVGMFSDGEHLAMLHWDGNGWTTIARPGLDPGEISDLGDVAAISSNEVWTAGSVGRYYLRARFERWVGSCQTPSPTTTAATTATATATATATSTSTFTPAPTGTHVQSPTATSTIQSPASSTPTLCPIQFTDVPEGSTFYPHIRCLACRGIINGYADGTFKPNNLVTRGQLSKIVSNAAGFSDPQTTQMFQDVPLGSTFFDFVGRLVSRGYVGGYACGGPGEPCVSPGNLPYFRPNNNATRGQISKIVSNAAGFTDPPSGQTFQDVPIGSIFFDFIERLATRGAIGGYTCGGPAEPCMGPGNLPYFRPNNNATRGQTSKIVGNTFFPGCNPPIH